MTLAAVVDSLDSIPEALREIYKPSADGKFVLDADVDAHPTVAGLKRNTSAAVSERKKLEQQLATFKPIIGERTPEEIAEILSAHAATEEERAKKAGEFDKLRLKDAEKIRAEYEPKVKEGEVYRQKYEALEYETTVKSAFLEAGGDPEKMRHALSIARDRIARGKQGLEVLNELGEPSGKSLKDFFASDFKADAPYLYLGSDARGSGAGSDAAGRTLPAGVVSIRDTGAFLANLDGIASRKVMAK
ncbi:MAG TPA: hypothetical protein VN613_09485 [Gemmatimonadaceae bacterium]|nr:hypothetical protein [Gemmatimonadaceae bacterium]